MVEINNDRKLLSVDTQGLLTAPAKDILPKLHRPTFTQISRLLLGNADTREVNDALAVVADSARDLPSGLVAPDTKSVLIPKGVKYQETIVPVTTLHTDEAASHGTAAKTRAHKEPLTILAKNSEATLHAPFAEPTLTALNAAREVTSFNPPDGLLHIELPDDLRERVEILRARTPAEHIKRSLHRLSLYKALISAVPDGGVVRLNFGEVVTQFSTLFLGWLNNLHKQAYYWLLDSFWRKTSNKPEYVERIKLLVQEMIVNRRLNSNYACFSIERSVDVDYTANSLARIVIETYRETVVNRFKEMEQGREDRVAYPHPESTQPFVVLFRMGGKAWKILFNINDFKAAITPSNEDLAARNAAVQRITNQIRIAIAVLNSPVFAKELKPEDFAHTVQEGWQGTRKIQDQPVYDENDLTSAHVAINIIPADIDTMQNRATNFEGQTGGCAIGTVIQVVVDGNKIVRLIAHGAHALLDGAPLDEALKKIIRNVKGAIQTQRAQSEEQLSTPSSPSRQILESGRAFIEHVQVFVPKLTDDERQKLKEVEKRLRVSTGNGNFMLNENTLMQYAIMAALGVEHAHFLEMQAGDEKTLTPALAVMPTFLADLLRFSPQLPPTFKELLLSSMSFFSDERKECKAGFGTVRILAAIASPVFRPLIQKFAQLLDKRTNMLVKSTLVSVLNKAHNFTPAIADEYDISVAVSNAVGSQEGNWSFVCHAVKNPNQPNEKLARFKASLQQTFRNLYECLVS